MRIKTALRPDGTPKRKYTRRAKKVEAAPASTGLPVEVEKHVTALLAERAILAEAKAEVLRQEVFALTTQVAETKKRYENAEFFRIVNIARLWLQQGATVSQLKEALIKGGWVGDPLDSAQADSVLSTASNMYVHNPVVGGQLELPRAPVSMAPAQAAPAAVA